MTDPKNAYQVPQEMRDFAERSVDQARKAVDGFMGAVHKALDTFETSAGDMASAPVSVSRKAMDFAETNVAASFAFAQQLVKATTVEEVMKLQNDFLRSQMSTMNEQAKAMGEAMTPPGGAKKA